MSRLYLFLTLTGLLLQGSLVADVVGAPRLAGADSAGSAPVLIFPPGTGAPVRVRATEDTLPESRVFEMPEVKVQEVRVPLIEIIRKAQEGERRKFAGLTTMAHTEIVKVTMKFGGKKPDTRCIEQSVRVYYRAPDTLVRIPVREKRYRIDATGVESPWDEDEERVGVEVGNGRRLTELPFYLRRLDAFNFRILERKTNAEQVLYRIAFEPRSDFDNLPGGTMWLLTGGYQIIHEEFHVRNLPVPWILKSLGLLTREWQEVAGRWVEKRITARAELGMNFLGVPESIEVVQTYEDYRFDPEIDPRIFEEAGR